MHFMSTKIDIFTDGGARGNPGPAATGVVMYRNNQKIKEVGTYIGQTTNNVAEYRAIIQALQMLVAIIKEEGSEVDINCFLDSNLVVSQINGVFKIKDANLRMLYMEVMAELSQIHLPVNFFHIPREKNSAADAMVNKALDEKLTQQ